MDKIIENLLLTDSKYIKQKEYWLKKLTNDMGKTKIFTNNKKNPNNQKVMEKKEICFSQPLSQRIMELSNRSDLTIYIILLAGLKSLIYRYTNCRDILVISPIYELNVTDETLNNYLLIRDQVRGDITFKDLILQISQSVLEAYENQDYPFEKSIHHLNPNQVLNSHLLSDICCLLQNIHDDGIIYKIETTLVFSFIREEEQLKGFIIYDPGIYEDYFINQLARHFVKSLEVFLRDSGKKIAGISFLSEKEKKQLILNFNNTGVTYPEDKTLQQLFVQQVEKTPGHTALAYNDQRLSYRELDKRSNQLAHFLKEKGIIPGGIAALMVMRSPEMIIAILAILKAGGAYLAVDPVYPQKRITYMLEDCQAGILLTQNSVLKLLDLEKVKFQGEIIEPGKGEIYSGDSSRPALLGNPHDIAYIIYTSGSTGNPQGVMIEHTSAVNLVYAQKEEFKIDETDRILQFSSICFDASVEQICIAFFSGAILFLVDKDTLLNKDKFAGFLLKHQITHIHAVPSFLNTIDVNDAYPLKRVIAGGDACPVQLARRWYKKYDFYNEYGPTETTVTSIELLVKEIDDNLSQLPIGKPLNNTQVYILDQWMRLAPPGAVGELYIGGAGVARGYLNQPQLTAEKFLPDPFITGKRMYKSGDLGRRMPNGNILFLGRIDHQVKIRGYRIELGEIENHLLAHPQIKETTVIAKDQKEDKFLCGYFVSDVKLTVPVLREHLLKKLPGYMIPSYFVQLEKIPLTAHGKIDRKALPSHETGEAAQEYTPPRNQTEKKLVEIWAKILERPDSIGIDDSFFELGGQSLKATILIAQIHKELDVRVPLIEVFRSLTIRELSKFIKNAMKEKHDSIDAIEIKEFYPLSSAQKRLFVTNQLDPGDLSYNMPIVKLLKGVFERKPIEQTIKNLIERHQSLRTSFKLIDGEPVQRIHRKNDVNFTLQYHELPEQDASQFISRFICPFDLGTAPLFRMGILKIDEKKHILIVDMHHIITDGASLNIFIKDFFTIFLGGALPALRIQYKDFSRWHNKKKKKETCKKQEEYWLNQFKDEIPILNLPCDFPRPVTKSFEGKHLQFEIDSKNIKTLQKLASDENATLFIVLLSVYYILLSKLSGQEDIIVGTVHHGRTHSDLDNIVGMLVNTLALRNYPGGDKTYIDFLRELKRRTIEAFENQDYQFDDLVGKLRLKRDPGRNPLFDASFEFQEMKPGTVEIPGLERLPFENDINISPVDINFNGIKSADNLTFVIQYSTKLFEENTIKRIGGYYENIVEIITRDPYLELADVEIITPMEKEKYMTESPKIFTQEAVDHFDFS